MFSSINISNTLGNPKEQPDLRMKENVEDFIVQEVVDNVKCVFLPLIRLEKYYEAEKLLKELPKNEILKEERRNVYSIVNYHPFVRVFTKDSKFILEKQMEDVFVFTLLKYDYSFNSLINLLTNRLGVCNNCIQMGGTKDKRGITLQEVSVKCSFERLFNYAYTLSKNESLKIPKLGYEQLIDETNEKIKLEMEKHMKVDLMEVSDPIMIFNIRRGNSKKLGDLDGNFFRIKIRGLYGFKLEQTLFLNYFGPQRFGTNLNNHVVGKCILDEKYDEALDLILWDNQNYNPVQKMIIKLRDSKNKAKFIVSRLPRHVQMIYLHAYQSFLFNESINERFESKSPKVNEDKVLKNGVFEDATKMESLENIYLPLKKMENKLLKGGLRKMIEEMKEIDFYEDSEGTVINFYLSKSCYATVALRELIGNFSLASGE